MTRASLCPCAEISHRPKRTRRSTEQRLVTETASWGVSPFSRLALPLSYAHICARRGVGARATQTPSGGRPWWHASPLFPRHEEKEGLRARPTTHLRGSAGRGAGAVEVALDRDQLVAMGRMALMVAFGRRVGTHRGTHGGFSLLGWLVKEQEDPAADRGHFCPLP